MQHVEALEPGGGVHRGREQGEREHPQQSEPARCSHGRASVGADPCTVKTAHRLKTSVTRAGSVDQKSRLPLHLGRARTRAALREYAAPAAGALPPSMPLVTPSYESTVRGGNPQL